MGKKFENHIIDAEKSKKILKFDEYGEYRKGSNKYGTFIQDVMMFLRNFNKNDEENLIIKTKDIKFDLNTLIELLNDENKTRLISFNVKFTDKNNKDVKKPDNNGFVVFTDLNKKNDRPWESKYE